jgi:hypothetical protein
MSVKLMAMAFEAQIPDQKYVTKGGKEQTIKSSTLKLILLALADHASDSGEAVYPSIDYLQYKTSIKSRSTLTASLGALKKLQIISQVRIRQHGNKEYRISSSGLQIFSSSPASGLPAVQPVDSTSPASGLESSLTTNESLSVSEKSPKPMRSEKQKANDLIHDAVTEVTKFPAGSFNGRVTAELRKINPGKTPEWIASEVRRRFGSNGLWYQRDFRSRGGKRPTPMQLVQEWFRIDEIPEQQKAREVYG